MITAEQINALKTKINTEVSRRTNSKSVTDATISNPAFEVTPSVNGKILAEHGTKTIGVLAQFSKVGSIPKGGGNFTKDATIPAEFDNTMLTNYVNNLAAKSATAAIGESNTGCASSCTGLCAGNCYSACTGDFSGNFSGSFSGDFSGSFSGDGFLTNGYYSWGGFYQDVGGFYSSSSSFTCCVHGDFGVYFG